MCSAPEELLGETTSASSGLGQAGSSTVFKTAPSGLMSSLDATLVCKPKGEVCRECFPSA